VYRDPSNMHNWLRTPIELTHRGKANVVFVILAALGGFLWMGRDASFVARGGVDPVQSEVRAQRFVVVDSAGNERAELGIRPDGKPALRLWDDTRTLLAQLEIDQAGMPRLAFETGDGTPLVQLGVLDKQYPVFIMGGADGKRGIGMAVGEGMAATIGLYDSKNTSRLRLSLDEKGHPVLRLKDEQGTDRVRLMIGSDGSCALDLLDPKERPRSVLQVDAHGEPDLALLKSDGMPIWSARGSSN
jgi:hypothetical protein